MSEVNTYQIAFSAWREVDTKVGPRQVRSGEPTAEFWDAWRGESEKMKLRGFALSKNLSGAWQVAQWREISPEETASRDEARNASRAAISDAEIPVPDGLSYLPYQKAGIVYATSRPNTLIGDEMGLGKTIQAIGVINSDPTVYSAIVVCPASLRLNWQREIEKWSVRPFRIGIVEGSKFPKNDPEIVIINYDVLAKHLPRLSESIFDVGIFDEAHYLKNLKTQRTKAALALKSLRWLFLTGTPILNKPIELFPMLTRLDPEGLGKNFMSYARRYCKAHKTRFGWDFSGSSNLPELQDKLRERCMVRRKKADVLKDLPPKRRQVIEVSPDKSLRLIDDEHLLVAKREATLVQLRIAYELAKASDDDAEYRAALESLRSETRITFSTMAETRKLMALEKVPYVVEHLRESIEGGPVVCFAHHREVIARIFAEFPNDAVVITGDTNMADRQWAVDEFQAGRKRLFLGNMQAAGVGLTLTASSHVVFAELDWTPAVILQAEDRCHRIGQQNSVLVQHILFEKSIDANMAKAIVSKQNVIDDALDNERLAEIEDEVVEPKREPAATESLSRTRLKAAAKNITVPQSKAIHEALRLLASYCDGAREVDGAGFNKLDTAIGKSLAYLPALTQRQAALGATIVRKYRRQIPADLLAVIFTENGDSKNGGEIRKEKRRASAVSDLPGLENSGSLDR